MERPSENNSRSNERKVDRRMSRKKEIQDGVKASFFISEAMMTEMKREAARLDVPVSQLLRRSWAIVLPQIEEMSSLPADVR